MAIGQYFGNRRVQIPGSYATITSGETSSFRDLDFGKCLIIDTGVLGAGFGGGAGVNGEFSKGKDSIYSFRNVEDFRFYVKGGLFWQLAQGLFTPDKTNPSAAGVSELLYVRAATTTSATMTFTATGGGAKGGTLKIKTVDEGLCANGKKLGTNLTQGYGFNFKVGTVNPSKWVMQIWRGTFTGIYAKDGLPYNEVLEAQTKPMLMVQSPEFSTMGELQNWAKTDTTFNKYFRFDTTSTISGDGSINGSDISAVTDYSLATGGTETYDASAMAQVIKSIEGLDFNFVFTDQYGSNYNNQKNKDVIAQVTADKYKKFFHVALEDDEPTFNKSITAAQTLNNPYVVATHGSVALTSTMSPSGVRWWGAIYNMAAQIGRIAGLQPQIPVTTKSIGVDRLKHQFDEQNMNDALDAGLLVTIYDSALRRNIVLQGINTLQDNRVLFTQDGKSFSIQFMRCIEQLNRELIVNSKIDLLSVENGVNSNTLNAGVLKSWTEKYLQSKVATETEDNLLLDARNVSVTKVGDSYQVNYEVVINNEINKIFFTGFLFSK